MVRYSVMGLPPASSVLCLLRRFVCGGSRSVRGWLGYPVRTEPLPTILSDALCLEQILLVVVLVLDVLWVDRRRGGDARRPVRTEPRPTALSVALCLEQFFSSSFSLRTANGPTPGLRH
jgi:hypothetical protein